MDYRIELQAIKDIVDTFPSPAFDRSVFSTLYIGTTNSKSECHPGAMVSPAVQRRRFELEGDAVLSALTVKLLLRTVPQADVEHLTRLKDNLVNNKTLALFATAYRLHHLVNYGEPDLETGPSKLYGDLFEVWIGSQQDPLDNVAVKTWIETVFARYMKTRVLRKVTDAVEQERHLIPLAAQHLYRGEEYKELMNFRPRTKFHTFLKSRGLWGQAHFNTERAHVCELSVDSLPPSFTAWAPTLKEAENLACLKLLLYHQPGWALLAPQNARDRTAVDLRRVKQRLDRGYEGEVEAVKD